MAYLAVEGDRSIYYEHFSGAKQPILLIHGWGMSGRVWDTTVAALLANGNEVVRIDQRCCGRSDKDFGDVSIDALGSDVVRLVDHLDLGGTAINGWSLGGAVAVDATAKLGRSAAGLVLTGGASPRYTEAPDWTIGGSQEALDGSLALLSTDRVNFLMGLTQAVCHVDVGAQVIDWMWQIFMESSPRADESLRDLGRVDQRDLMGKLEIPALVMHGDHDVIVSTETGARAADLLPNGRLVAFADSGHAPFLEEPAKYWSELLSFLDSL